MPKIKHNDISFWLMVVAIICFAFGTLPTFHGLFCGVVGTGLVICMRIMAKWEAKNPDMVAPGIRKDGRL
jgi:hypothetical protein